MLRKHAAVIAELARDRLLAYHVRTYFCLPHRTAITPAMYQRGLGQADLVLALLRIEHPRAREFIEKLIGHPIVIGPSCLLMWRTNGAPVVQRSVDPTDRKIAWVHPTNPRQPGTDAHMRWCQYQVGRTVGQLRTRGVRRRDIRLAARRGWIQFEEVAHV